MTPIFRKLFTLFPGEERSALLFALLAFFWASAAASGLKFADALFLLHIGPEKLPLLYSMSAGCMILIATLLIYAFHTFQTYKVFITALSISTLFYLFVFLSFSYAEKESWIWYVLRVAGSVNLAVLGTTFWTFIDQYYHLQEGKRLFSLFNSMIFLGITLTGFIMLLGLIEFQMLALLIAGFLTVSIFLIRLIHRQEKTLPDDYELEAEPLSYRKLFRGIFGSRFTLLLMSSNLLIYLLMATTEFNYYSTFDRLFDPTGDTPVGDEADATLTLFLGRALAGVSLTNVIFGLFFYSRLLRRFGIGWLLPITPILLLFTYSSWQFSEALWIALTGYFVVEGTNYVIDDANFNMLLGAVPNKFKHKIRVAIESFFEPIGTLFAAALLTWGIVNPRLLGLILSALLLIVAILLKKNYLKALWKNLAENALHFERTTADWFRRFSLPDKRFAERKLLRLLNNKELTPFSMECLIDMEDRALLKELAHFAESFSLENKVLFIRLIQDSELSSDACAIELAQRWLMEAEDPRLVEELYWYLAQEGVLHPHKLNDELESDNLKLKGAAILTLITAQADIDPHEAWKNKTEAYEHIQELFDSEKPENIEMGLKILASDPSALGLDMVLSYLTDESPYIQREAAKVVWLMSDPKFQKQAPRVAAMLFETKESKARIYLLKALGEIGDSRQVETILTAATQFRPHERRAAEEAVKRMGLKIVPLLILLLKDNELSEKCRLSAGKVLGALSLSQLRARLKSVLEPEIEKACFFLRALNRTQKDPSLKLLTQTLQSDYYSSLDFIIQLLGVAGEVEDTELLSRSIRSGKVKIESQAIETLEKTCEPEIFRMLQPLFEKNSYPSEEETLDEILLTLRNSSSIADKIVAFTFMKAQAMTGWKTALKKEMTAAPELFKQLAYELLES